MTPEALSQEIPPKFKTQLLSGDITAEEYLGKCFKFLTKDKQVAAPTKSKQPNLSTAGGGVQPTKEAVGEDLVASYEHTIF